MSTRTVVTLYAYERCDSCRKALRFLALRGVTPTVVPIVERPPCAAELRALIARSGLPARRWVNTSGQSYRTLVAARGKAAVDALIVSSDLGPLVSLLAADGKLIRRPVLVTPDCVLVGFREDEYEAAVRPR